MKKIYTDDTNPTPKEVRYLLGRWGRSLYDGMPNLGTPSQSAVVGEYRAPGYRSERVTYSSAEYDQLCAIIDDKLNGHECRALACKYRHHLNPRRSAWRMGIGVVKYREIFETAERKVVRLMEVANDR